MVWLLILCFILAGPSARALKADELCSAAYDYKDALSKAILFFEGQRSGKLPDTQRVKWRGDSALSDGKPDNVRLVGGYYDAGDNVKFGWPMAFSVSLLSWAAVENQKAISSVSQMEYLRSAIRWGADFILTAHTSPTTLYTQVGDGNQDHQCWERPEDMDTPRTLYKITSSSPGTEAAAEAAAALSAASIVFKGVDSNYSSKLLSHSKSLFEFADKYRGSYQASCPFYCSYSGYQDELLWAAAWLYKASGQTSYLNYVSSNQGWSQAVSEFSWDNKFRWGSNITSKVMPGSSSVQIRTTPGGLLYTRDSSNLQYVTSASMVLLTYSKILSAAKIGGIQCGSAQFLCFSNHGLCKNTEPHPSPPIKSHPAKIGCNEGSSTWYSSANPNPNTHVGAIVGGPDSSDRFNDLRSDYSHSEPTTYLNAAFVGSVAALLGENNNVGDECLGMVRHNGGTISMV
ncbi:glycosyl hydrolase 9B15 [Actinidia rufa]|uniref:Endoglucanase n=1 Tax=Actinidia rufa TaxID=165716 RepID=A0A7J0FRW4_9ERIC|nr:glycosyl hydrolase 9B15 [Actinidia rufa]